jgi:HAMP domain-containing protein
MPTDRPLPSAPARSSFRWRVFVVLVGLVVLALGAVLWLVWRTGDRLATQAVEQSIQDSAAAQSRYEELSAERLQSMAQAMATDAAVINYLDAALNADTQAVALDGTETAATPGEDAGGQNLSIRDLILERRDSIGFGLALVLDAEGSLVAHSGETEAFADAYRDDPLLGSVFDSLEPAIGYWREADVIYHAAATPIAKGDLLVGFLLIAMPVDAAFCAQIHETSGAHAAVWRIEPQGLRLQASSLPAPQAQALAEQAPVFAALDASAASLPMTLQGEQFLTRNRAMRGQADGEPVAVLMALGSSDAAAAGFLRLREQILIATGIAVVVALLLAWWLSRRLVLPVLRAAEAAELAAAGNYQQSLPDTGRDELGRLSQAVNLLLSDLRERRDVESYVGSLQRLQAEPVRETRSVPSIEPKRFRDWTLLALDLPQFVATPELAQTERHLGVLEQHVQLLRAAGESNAGELLGTQGRQWLWGFAEFKDALRCVQALATSRLGSKPAMAIAQGEVFRAALDAQHPQWLGKPLAMAQRLLVDSAPGVVLLSPEAATATRGVLGDKAVSVATGSLSGKRFHALLATGEEARVALALLPARQDRPTDSQATVVTPADSVALTRGGSARLQPGSLFARRYEIDAVLGSGGMGMVYRARDRELKDVVALKTLRPDAMLDIEHLERFKSELKLARSISHPNVLRTYDFGQSEGLPFISMEYVRGMTLRYLLQQPDKVPYSAALRLARQLCAGLAAAHAVGVLHRDIKPENLIIDPQGHLKLMDFGIARQSVRTSGLTQQGMFVGTPDYAAPEQLMGEEVDVRADLYAVGVTLCELFCGSLPFRRGNSTEVMLAHLQEEPTLPSELWPEIPPALEKVLLRCLERQRTQRYASANALLEDLAELRA